MFQLSTKELAELGAEITTREIKQQPELWQETLTIYQEKQERSRLSYIPSSKRRINAFGWSSRERGRRNMLEIRSSLLE